ncbi:HemK2/MTQ2 family protein methyltransferase [Streptomyces sp. SID3343]|uniref:HemK2/MTQ2 family protein methyltransferase n=1 Tax=Streptomyces sp. SID3343 TaxID=2690260 RepID=UPI00136EC70C|nr:HemK2/MTQ2 family protein methyltransferase [Streptomyces sp. SID3343]MYW03799.1 methyltransferase [Streptomyces sp. SID3343]
MRMLRLPGTYRPQADTRLLASAFVEQGLHRVDRVLDVGTGTGAVALAAASAGSCRVTAVDVSRQAVWTARLNSAWRRRGVSVLRGDLLEPVRGQTFDVVLANPPYVPSPEENAPRRGRARAWDAGTDGRLVLDRLCAQVPIHLNPGGTLLVVHSVLCGVGTTLGLLESVGLRAQVVARSLEPFGPVLTARAAFLEKRGLLRPGCREEELVVVRGDFPS